ncbi:MAG: hypothetical protein ACRCYX_00455 [Dermatophilaceae bacterium]
MTFAPEPGRLTLYGLGQGELLARQDDFATAATNLDTFVDQRVRCRGRSRARGPASWSRPRWPG